MRKGRKWEYLMFYEYETDTPEGSHFDWMSLDGYIGNNDGTSPRYQYKSIREAGLDGWEIISIDETNPKETNVFFKREI
jgi:hypothetical protein